MKLSKDEVMDELAMLVDAIILFPDHMTDTAPYMGLVAMLRKLTHWLRDNLKEDNE